MNSGKGCEFIMEMYTVRTFLVLDPIFSLPSLFEGGGAPLPCFILRVRVVRGAFYRAVLNAGGARGFSDGFLGRHRNYRVSYQ